MPLWAVRHFVLGKSRFRLIMLQEKSLFVTSGRRRPPEVDSCSSHDWGRGFLTADPVFQTCFCDKDGLRRINSRTTLVKKSYQYGWDEIISVMKTLERNYFTSS